MASPPSVIAAAAAPSSSALATTEAVKSRSLRVRSDQLVISAISTPAGTHLTSPSMPTSPAPPARYAYTDVAVNAARSPA